MRKQPTRKQPTRTGGFFTVLAVAALISAPAFAQSGSITGTAPRQPTGAMVPAPDTVPATRATTTQSGTVGEHDAMVTGSVRSRDTTGLPQSPENLNILGCRQIDPLCQGSR